VDWTLAELAADDGTSDQAAPEQDVLVLQPRLDGTGGTLWGNLGPVGFAAGSSSLFGDTEVTVEVSEEEGARWVRWRAECNYGSGLAALDAGRLEFTDGVLMTTWPARTRARRIRTTGS
jgi:hypothetical protein